MWSRLSPVLRSFCSARGGNVAIVFAFGCIALIGFVGAAVDYSRANSLKAAMQGALDATTLKLGRQYSTLTGTQLQDKGAEYFCRAVHTPRGQKSGNCRDGQFVRLNNQGRWQCLARHHLFECGGSQEHSSQCNVDHGLRGAIFAARRAGAR